MAADPLLAVQDLRVSYPGPRVGVLGRKRLELRAVDGISFDIARGQTLGLVGESGCGKSSAALALLRLTQAKGGRVQFEGRDILLADAGALRNFRREAQIVFQDPYSSLHPRKTVRAILSEPFELHTSLGRRERLAEVRRLLTEVGLPTEFTERHAHQLSGGQRQRVAIARALALRPKLIVLDEPVSALDVSIRAQIIALLRRLQVEHGLAYLFISHDLALVRAMCDTTAVMYLGKIVEYGATTELFAGSAHPYTRALLAAIPVPDPEVEARRERLRVPGELPTPLDPPSGCHFHPRCTWAEELCSRVEPTLEPMSETAWSACHRREAVSQQPAEFTRR